LLVCVDGLIDSCTLPETYLFYLVYKKIVDIPKRVVRRRKSLNLYNKPKLEMPVMISLIETSA